MPRGALAPLLGTEADIEVVAQAGPVTRSWARRPPAVPTSRSWTTNYRE